MTMLLPLRLLTLPLLAAGIMTAGITAPGAARAAAAIQASQGKVVFSLGPAEAILALAAWCDEAGRSFC